MFWQIVDKFTSPNSRLFKANLGNSSTFNALNSENKIQEHSRFSRPRTNPAYYFRKNTRPPYLITSLVWCHFLRRTVLPSVSNMAPWRPPGWTTIWQEVNNRALGDQQLYVSDMHVARQMPFSSYKWHACSETRAVPAARVRRRCPSSPSCSPARPRSSWCRRRPAPTGRRAAAAGSSQTPSRSRARPRWTRSYRTDWRSPAWRTAGPGPQTWSAPEGHRQPRGTQRLTVASVAYCRSWTSNMIRTWGRQTQPRGDTAADGRQRGVLQVLDLKHDPHLRETDTATWGHSGWRSPAWRTAGPGPQTWSAPEGHRHSHVAHRGWRSPAWRTAGPGPQTWSAPEGDRHSHVGTQRLTVASVAYCRSSTSNMIRTWGTQTQPRGTQRLTVASVAYCRSWTSNMIRTWGRQTQPRGDTAADGRQRGVLQVLDLKHDPHLRDTDTATWDTEADGRQRGVLQVLDLKHDPHLRDTDTATWDTEADGRQRGVLQVLDLKHDPHLRDTDTVTCVFDISQPSWNTDCDRDPIPPRPSETVTSPWPWPLTHVGGDAEPLPVRQGQQLVVVEHRVEVLHPLGVDVAVEDDPLSLPDLTPHVVYDPTQHTRAVRNHM